MHTQPSISQQPYISTYDCLVQVPRSRNRTVHTSYTQTDFHSTYGLTDCISVMSLANNNRKAFNSPILDQFR